MKFESLAEANEFIRVARECKGQVRLKTIYSDVFNLKSKLMGYVTADALLTRESDAIELECEFPEDEQMLRQFLTNLEEKHK